MIANGKACLLLLALPALVAGQICYERGVCHGDLLGAALETSTNACLERCRNAFGCTWSSYNNEDQFCGLFLTCDYRDTDACPLCISAESSCTPLECDAPGQCIGTLEFWTQVSSLVECQVTCAVLNNCQYYTYNPSESLCLHFSDCPLVSGDQCADCSTGQPICLIEGGIVGNGTFDNAEYLLVAAGNSISAGDAVELVALNPALPVPECLQNLNDMPEPGYESVGGVLTLDRIAHVCHVDEGDLCYGYDSATDSWTVSGNTIAPTRDYASYTSHPLYGILIVGGRGVSSVEFTRDGSTFRSLPDLPRSTEKPCVAVLSNGDVFVAGGNNAELDDALIYSSSTEQWTAVASMPEAKDAVYCGAVVNSTTGHQEVVVAGGYNGARYTDAVDIYTVETDSWRTGNNLPSGAAHGSSVPHGDTFLIVGGQDYSTADYLDTVYEYDLANDAWIERSRMKLPRRAPAAMTVTRSMFPDC